jgi:hypothetical protein
LRVSRHTFSGCNRFARKWGKQQSAQQKFLDFQMECAVLNNSDRFKLLSAGDQVHSASFCLAPGNRVGMQIPIDQYIDLFESLKI